ncbi:M6 family metalloprotease domain-containing protein [Viscerimonas tarda]
MRYFIPFFFLALFAWPVQALQDDKDLANLVCFVRFADEDETIFDKTADYYEQLFNNEAESSGSVYNYFQQASYKQLKWKSVMYPVAGSSTIVSYKAQQNRGYYLHSSSINPEGYDENNAGDALLREQNLVKEISDYLHTIVPADRVIDKNNDGVVDNICLILSGNSEISSRYIFWPHRSSLYIKQSEIREKKVNEYILLFDGANGWNGLAKNPLNAGVLCHEMSHTLGTRDLYHTKKGLNPVGVWDLMSDNLSTPQGMSAYTKYKYCKWTDDLQEISTPGVYTLKPVGGSDKNNTAYKLKLVGSDEYFVLEYRKKEGPFEIGLPSSGLLIYRINPNFTGNENYDGTTKFDEQYLFRPGGSATADGDISKAAFSQESGRTAFGGTAVEKPFYTDGTEACFAIANISVCGETISFELLTAPSSIHLSQDSLRLNGNAGSSSKIQVQGVNTSWKIESLPDWLEVSPSTGTAGSAILTFSAKTVNSLPNLRSVVIKIASETEPDVYSELTVIQQSAIIQPPSDLDAKQNGNVINLTWTKPIEGAPILSEDFESLESSSLWEIKTANNVGWSRQESAKYKLPYKGLYSARLDSEMQDCHQDEWLISPPFFSGGLLTFYSNSIAPQKNNNHNFYFVELSNDNGITWEQIYDLKAQSSALNKYEYIELDISSYIPDNMDYMRVAFHACDDNNMGLSYWWHVDNVLVYPKTSASIVKSYHIFRNGEKIASTSECSFTDSSPLTGQNTYTVRSLGDFGETPFSNEAKVNFSPTGIGSIPLSDNIKIAVKDGIASIIGDEDLTGVSLYDISGRALYSEVATQKTYNIPLSAGIRPGVYIVKIMNKNQVFKIIIP